MVFSSSPVYLQDQYPSWHQQTYHQQEGISHVVKDSQLQQSVLPPPPKAGGGGGLMTKPSSMTDRARLARLPQPESGLNCPRCDSTNTKFCYFNNYNLSQPRHFCKSCRRYWTRGGSLRNVPVGGGCRKNKRSKNNSRSNSQVKTGQQTGPKSTSSSPSSDISGHLPQPSVPPLFPFMAGGLQCSSGFQTQVAVATGGVLGGGQADDLGFHMGVDQWRLPNLFSGIETPAISGFTGQLNYPLKMEEKQGFQMGNLGNSNQYWGGNSWADFSSINSSSATHLL